ncbi:hypothetical protein HELRODRAFT_180134 [Helobdella robusta]|uniref:Uncharacterized protein n=1 Tax=Helobdella robusta TaxID=6412 RepID=T1FFI3_HELRO|nr:hypothetical protein HELRODRAFT_180134 [Helobdella robusta]ESN94792.1 hypothetical protein HELRODRAFT_180134 [Helobdella robusta]
MSFAYPKEQSTLTRQFAKDFFLSVLENGKLELKVGKSENLISELKTLERQMTQLRQMFQEFHRSPRSTTQTKKDDDCYRCGQQPISIDGIRKLGLLESDSSVSILPTLMVNVSKTQLTTKSLKAANNTEIPITRQIKLLIEVDKHSKPASILLSNSVSEILLGLEWLKFNNVSLKFEQTKITIGNDCAAVALVTNDVGVKWIPLFESHQNLKSMNMCAPILHNYSQTPIDLRKRFVCELMARLLPGFDRGQDIREPDKEKLVAKARKRPNGKLVISKEFGSGMHDSDSRCIFRGWRRILFNSGRDGVKHVAMAGQESGSSADSPCPKK